VKFEIRPLTEADALEMIGWHYDAPYAAYDPPPGALRSLIDPSNRFFAVDADACRLVGFCCFGEHAKIPGCGCDADEPGVIDVGVGLRPEMTGRGLGRAFVAAIVHFAAERFTPTWLRASIAQSNGRSIRVFEGSGFDLVRSFSPGDSKEAFWELKMRIGG
jgi:[ribosomal protein S18]-alanine N-acetyltransferase